MVVSKIWVLHSFVNLGPECHPVAAHAFLKELSYLENKGFFLRIVGL